MYIFVQFETLHSISESGSYTTKHVSLLFGRLVGSCAYNLFLAINVYPTSTLRQLGSMLEMYIRFYRPAFHLVTQNYCSEIREEEKEERGFFPGNTFTFLRQDF